MEMEHINENTIRVLIDNDDLAARGITFLDLLGNHKEIENFFYSILEEVDIEDEFRGSEAVTFQVLPKGDGLELFISKNLQGDELDQAQDMANTPPEALSQFIRKQLLEDENDDELEESLMNQFVFALADFEDLVLLAKEIFIESLGTWLYRYDDQLFLQVNFSVQDLGQQEMDEQLAQVLEFAYHTSVTPEVLSEYGEVLINGNALEQMRFYFK